MMKVIPETCLVAKCVN